MRVCMAMNISYSRANRLGVKGEVGEQNLPIANSPGRRKDLLKASPQVNLNWEMIMVPKEEPFMAVELPNQVDKVLLLNPASPIHSHIPKVVPVIFWFDPEVMVFNQGLVHLPGILERPVREPYDVLMAKMEI